MAETGIQLIKDKSKSPSLCYWDFEIITDKGKIVPAAHSGIQMTKIIKAKSPRFAMGVEEL